MSHLNFRKITAIITATYKFRDDRKKVIYDNLSVHLITIDMKGKHEVIPYLPMPAEFHTGDYHSLIREVDGCVNWYINPEEATITVHERSYIENLIDTE